jgi:hypothetical protein
MPNHVTQQLIIVGADSPKVIHHIAGSDTAVDFNTIIPMPKELEVEDSSDGQMGLAAITGDCTSYLTFPWVKDQGIGTAEEFAAYVERERPQAIELARKYLANKQKFGHMTWRDWCYANWGTKWNAYSVSEPEIVPERAVIRFNTAWSPAIPVIAKLSERFPSVPLILRYFDEGWGFAGEARFESGIHFDDCFAPDANDSRTRFIYVEVYDEDLETTDDDG